MHMPQIKSLYIVVTNLGKSIFLVKIAFFQQILGPSSAKAAQTTFITTVKTAFICENLAVKGLIN